MQDSEYSNMFNLETSHWWYCGLHDLIESLIASYRNQRVCEPERELSVFDAGCGTGGLMKRLSRYGSVTGIDYNQQAVLFCRQRGFTSVRQADLNTYTFTEKYDVIVCIDVLYHSAIKDDLTVFSKLCNALAPGGLLVLNLAAFDILRGSHDLAVSGLRRYQRNWIKKSLQMLPDCAIELLTYRMFFLFPVMLTVRVYSRFFTKVKNETDLKQSPGFVNFILKQYCRFENFIIRSKIPFPAGTSLFAVIRRKI